MVYSKGKAITPKVGKEHYTVDVLLDVLQSYQRMIERDNGKYPSAVLSDISASLNYVLRNCERV